MRLRRHADFCKHRTVDKTGPPREPRLPSQGRATSQVYALPANLCREVPHQLAGLVKATHQRNGVILRADTPSSFCRSLSTPARPVSSASFSRPTTTAHSPTSAQRPAWAKRANSRPSRAACRAPRTSCATDAEEPLRPSTTARRPAGSSSRFMLSPAYSSCFLPRPPMACALSSRRLKARHCPANCFNSMPAIFTNSRLFFAKSKLARTASSSYTGSHSSSSTMRRSAGESFSAFMRSPPAHSCGWHGPPFRSATQAWPSPLSRGWSRHPLP